MTQVWAHRGASGHAPENTMDAFEAAVRLGAHGIELDVHVSADGKVVVIHDDTLDRTCKVKGRIASMAAADITAAHAANGMAGFPAARVPLLDDVLDLVAGTSVIVNIELKSDQAALPAAVHRLVHDRGMDGSVIYSSFNHNALKAMHDLGSTAPIGLLLGQPLYEPWEYAAAIGAQAIHPPYQMLSWPDFVAASHRRGIAVNVWTLDTPPQWERARSLGVDAVITNHPAAAHGVLA